VKRLFLLAGLALALCGSIPPADATPQVAPVLVGSFSSRFIRRSGQPPEFDPSYAADPGGCVLANGFGDIAVLRAAGYTEPGKERLLALCPPALRQARPRFRSAY